MSEVTDVALCADCGKASAYAYFTEVNPAGGYGHPQVIVCDECMKGEQWADWRARKWPNWPNLPRVAS